MRETKNTQKRSRLLAAVLAAGLAGTAFAGGVMTNTGESLAQPVAVDAPQQGFGFADLNVAFATDS